MAADITEPDRQLEEFDARNSPQGLLERYARGRVAALFWRQITTLAGAAGVMLLISPALGALTGAMAVLGDVADCLYLRKVPGRLARHVPFSGIVFHSTVTAALHALTIAAGAALVWFSGAERLGSGLALLFLMVSAINAGIVLPFHKPATIARLAIYALSALTFVAVDLLSSQRMQRHVLFDLFAVLLMLYVCHMFITYVVNGQVAQARQKRNLLLQAGELARANAELNEQQREARYLALVAKHANDSVIMADADGRISWVNDAFTRITGFSPEEAVGHRPAELLNAPETCRETSDAIASAVAEGRAFRTQILNRTKDGRRIWIGTNLVPVRDAAGKVEQVIAIERDISVNKQHEAELARAKADAEKSEDAKAQFLATMSHEIRTPMNGIIGMADLLSEADLGRENRHYVETIRRSGEALLTIINDILDFSKLSAGRPATHAVAFTLRDPIDEAVTLLGPQARNKGLFVDVVAETKLPDRVFGDDGRLRQILINIIGNAIKFTDEGGVTVTVSSQSEGEGHRLSFAVRDTGIGIAPDRLEHVFEEFAQADAATTRQFGGTGLGLPISRLLAREMGGDITVASAPGAGALFTVTVLFDRVEQAAPDPAVAEPFLPERLAGKTVLVAEDNKTNRLLVRKYLKDQPVTLHFAENGRQAVEMTRAHDPDIVLMDMAMPEMDGLAATRAIRKTATTRPRIIALTANAFAADKAACLGAGMDGFLTKPLRKGELLRILAQAGTAPAAPDSRA